MAFQITDDVLDLVATEEFLGKPAGSDVGEGTFTLPVLYALDGTEGRRGAPPARRGPALLPGGRRRGDLPGPRRGPRGAGPGGGPGPHRGAAAALEALPAGPVAGVLRTLGDYLIARVEDARG